MPHRYNRCVRGCKKKTTIIVVKLHFVLSFGLSCSFKRSQVSPLSATQFPTRFGNGLYCCAHIEAVYPVKSAGVDSSRVDPPPGFSSRSGNSRWGPARGSRWGTTYGWPASCCTARPRTLGSRWPLIPSRCPGTGTELERTPTTGEDPHQHDTAVMRIFCRAVTSILSQRLLPKMMNLTLSLPRVINVKFLLHPHQKYYIAQYGEHDFS